MQLQPEQHQPQVPRAWHATTKKIKTRRDAALFCSTYCTYAYSFLDTCQILLRRHQLATGSLAHGTGVARGKGPQLRYHDTVSRSPESTYWAARTQVVDKMEGKKVRPKVDGDPRGRQCLIPYSFGRCVKINMQIGCLGYSW